MSSMRIVLATSLDADRTPVSVWDMRIPGPTGHSDWSTLSHDTRKQAKANPKTHESIFWQCDRPSTTGKHTLRAYLGMRSVQNTEEHISGQCTRYKIETPYLVHSRYLLSLQNLTGHCAREPRKPLVLSPPGPKPRNVIPMAHWRPQGCRGTLGNRMPYNL